MTENKAYFQILQESTLENVGLVKTIALKHQHRMELADLCQIGFIGLMKGLEGYQPELGPKSNYLGIKIQKEILRAIENYSRIIRIPSGQWETINRLKKLQVEQAQEEGVWSDLPQIATKIKLGKAGTAALDSFYQYHIPRFFGWPQSGHQESVEDLAETNILLEKINHLLVELDYQEEKVLNRPRTGIQPRNCSHN
jgi:RNA polymerase sigma factor (sigma-70 family)